MEKPEWEAVDWRASCCRDRAGAEGENLGSWAGPALLRELLAWGGRRASWPWVGGRAFLFEGRGLRTRQTREAACLWSRASSG